MGIDVYMKWNGQTEAERKAQYTGYSIEHGHVGYLREAYHGGPYVTPFLVREAYDDFEAEISAKVLRDRLPAAVMIAIYREHMVYQRVGDRAVVDVGDAAGTLGEGDLPTDLLTKVAATLADAKKAEGDGARIAATLTAEQIRATNALIESRKLPKFVLSFVDFVALAEKHEKRTGQPVLIHVSA